MSFDAKRNLLKLMQNCRCRNQTVTSPGTKMQESSTSGLLDLVGGDLVEYIAANYTRRAELLSTQRSYISPGLRGTAGNVSRSSLFVRRAIRRCSLRSWSSQPLNSSYTHAVLQLSTPVIVHVFTKNSVIQVSRDFRVPKGVLCTVNKQYVLNILLYPPGTINLKYTILAVDTITSRCALQ